jgi:hypothetical protein
MLVFLDVDLSEPILVELSNKGCKGCSRKIFFKYHLLKLIHGIDDKVVSPVGRPVYQMFIFLILDSSIQICNKR